MSKQVKKTNPNWNLKATSFAVLTDNPLRKLWEDQSVVPNPDKEVITLQIGDPTVFGNFPVANESIDAIKRAIDNDNFGYFPCTGMLSARQAVADYVKKNNEEFLTADDVILTSGCSMALEMCFRALANPGENILIPRPCWNYTTWILGNGIKVKFYNLDPTKDWEVNLKHMESQIDGKTKGLLINNIGNPCGNIFTKQHILDVLKIAERYQIPIISDDIYEHFNFVFPGVEYASISSLSKNVPILSCSGLSKRFLMPGIRMGWIVIHDKQNALKDVRQGLINASGRILGPNCTVQLALPEILRNTPQSYFDNAMEKISNHAVTAYNLFKDIPGLNPIMPKGAMYMMIGIDFKRFPQFSSCLEFTQAIIREQSVLTFPGAPCFDFPGFMRIVLTVPDDMIITACDRIKEFCIKYFVNLA
ncbi:unnamed protein product [Diamesa tonsa]